MKIKLRLFYIYVTLCLLVLIVALIHGYRVRHYQRCYCFSEEKGEAFIYKKYVSSDKRSSSKVARVFSNEEQIIVLDSLNEMYEIIYFRYGPKMAYQKDSNKGWIFKKHVINCQKDSSDISGLIRTDY